MNALILTVGLLPLLAAGPPDPGGDELAWRQQEEAEARRRDKLRAGAADVRRELSYARAGIRNREQDIANNLASGEPEGGLVIALHRAEIARLIASAAQDEEALARVEKQLAVSPRALIGKAAAHMALGPGPQHLGPGAVPPGDGARRR